MAGAGVSSLALLLSLSFLGEVAHANEAMPHEHLRALIESAASVPPPSPETTAIDWSQPPVACIENIVPVLPDRPCPDLTQVVNPTGDWPAGLSAADLQYWNTAKGPMDYCRGVEVLRREAQAPGTFNPGVIELFWMQAVAPDHATAKAAAIYQASREQKMPAQVLAGAVAQESMYAELGIAADGGNYSCGVGQINIQEWCRWANEQPAAAKVAMGWPTTIASCTDLSPQLIQPFYAIALQHLKGLREYRLNTSHFANIALKDVVKGFPAADDATQALRFQTAQSFIRNCADPGMGIRAKAHELALLFRQFVPAGLRDRDNYPAGEQFQRQCRDVGYTGAYPLHLGWLLAVGSYNAGPRAVDATAYYQRWSVDELHAVQSFKNFEPQDLVESLYGAGRYNSHTDRIDFTRIDDSPTSWLWLTQCILQRHIARVVQHVTMAESSPLVHSLEGSNGCRMSLLDANGHVVTSAVPPARRTSPGRK